MFFGVVVPSTSPSSSKDPVVLIKKMYSPPDFSKVPINSASTFRDVHHFLRVENWAKHVEGMTGEAIPKAVRDREPELRENVRLIVEAYSKDMVKELLGTDHAIKIAIGDYNGVGYTSSKLQGLGDDSIRLYTTTGTDLLVFCLGVVAGTIPGWAKTVHTNTIKDAATHFLTVLDAGSEDEKAEGVQALFYAIFSQKRTACADKYVFPRLAFSFLVLYAFRKEGHLDHCNNFTQSFSKLIWYARVVIFKIITGEAKIKDIGFFEALESYRPLLALQSDYPLSSLYHTKNLAKKMSEDHVFSSKVTICGQNMDVAILGSISVKLGSFGRMYRNLLVEVERAQRDLFGGIDFEDEEWFGFKVPMYIADEPNCIQPGYFFGDHEFNKGLQGFEDTGVNTLLNHPRLSNRYAFVRGEDELVMNVVACHDFLRRTELNRSMLASLAHSSYGGAARASEFVVNYYRNHPHGDIRNVMFIFGSLCFVSGYNKTSHATEKNNVIYRFVPKDLERLYLIDLLIIRPTEIFLASALHMQAAVEDLRFKLFPTVNQPFIASTLSKGLKRDTKAHLGSPIGIGKYRDIQSNFMDHHPDPNPGHMGNDIGSLQQGHTASLDTRWYKRSPDLPQGVGKGAMMRYQRASRWWQHITGIHELEETVETRLSADGSSVNVSPDTNPVVRKVSQLLEGFGPEIRSCISDGIAQAFASQRKFDSEESNIFPTQRTRYAPHPSLLKDLRVFLSDPNATFKTPEQAEALEVVVNSKEHLLLVGPTAMGKSLIYMLPASLHDRHLVTIVLLPLSSLHADFQRRCKQLNISSYRWTLSSGPKKGSIVYVSPEDAQRRDFLEFALGLHFQNKLARVVIDEPHLMLQHADFRFCFSNLTPLIAAEVPFVFITGTCPPALGTSMVGKLAVTNCHVIRAATDRPEISYNVELAGNVFQAKSLLVKAVKERLASTDANFRALVYCRSKDSVDKIADLIGCKPFHSDIPESERDVSFEEWVQGKERVMVCTSLLGCGIDVEGVQVVYHYLTPWSIMGFAQESGRAGRGGNWAESYVFASKQERDDGEPENAFGKEIMRNWVMQSSVCRRIALSSFLDNQVTTCTLLKNANICDVCKLEMDKPHPKRPVELALSPSSSTDVPKLGPLPTIPPSSVQYAREMYRRPNTPEPEGITVPDPVWDNSPETPTPSDRMISSASSSSLSVDRTRKRDEDENGENGHKRKRFKFSDVSQHPAYLELARRAEEEFNASRKNLLPDQSSIPIKGNSFIAQGDKRIAAIMVQDIRQYLEVNYRYCSVCLMLASDMTSDHESGISCTTVPLEGEAGSDWEGFKTGVFSLPGGTTCFKCLLPTNENRSVPGASHHKVGDCSIGGMLIRPVLFAFWLDGSLEAKTFVRENLRVAQGVDWDSLKGYTKWLAQKRVGFDTFNYLFLFWWLGVHAGHFR